MNKIIHRVILVMGLGVAWPMMARASESVDAGLSGMSWAWVMTRGMGLMSYLLIFLMTVTGILLTTGLLYRVIAPATAWSIHRTVGIIAFGSVILHVVPLLFDKVSPFSVGQILIPWLSTYQPWLVLWGIVGFYALLLILFTSLFKLNTRPGWWRFMHGFSFILFVAVFFHGLFIGTDTKILAIRVIYLMTGGIVAGLSIYRLAWKYSVSG